MAQDPIHSFREQIDQIDGQILELLNRRAAAALEIGRLKRASHQPIYVPLREEAVLQRMVNENRGPLPAGAVEAVFRAIMSEMRALEETAISPR